MGENQDQQKYKLNQEQQHLIVLKLGEPSSDSSHQHNSQRVSDVNCTPQGTISDQKCTERNASSIKNLDANLQGEQTAADGVTGRKNGFHDVTTENSEDTIAYDKIGVDEKASTVDARDGVDEDKVRVILPDPKECRNPGATPCKNGDSEYSGDQNNKSESPAEVDSGKSHTVVLSQNTLDSHSASGSIGAGNDSDDAANNQHLLKSVDEEKQHGQETAHAEAGSYKSDKPTNNPQLHQSDLSFILTYLPSPSGQNLLESNQENHEGGEH
ncbi:hypothetical protein PVBG_04834 [Plasmodium vivax Brazil I]|uniref:Uncharacterized protein n=1 Tax=Plasmodium vivax (strain Brazil I) TaxID=1033975 RepID=A0A0J9VN25_PLAV1|nr:hypothetical protein PVBG_06138 [Plasmodium vivax Brazil I]KMZ88626.1 hypothetical protein PVBG_04834 [Plasmodium vivax Brazil I]